MEKVWRSQGGVSVAAQRLSNGIMRQMALGIYISVPFCKTKCSYCNFASNVFSRAIFEKYIERVCADIAGGLRLLPEAYGRSVPEVDSIYFGGGTPTVLEASQLERIFAALRGRFDVQREAEITVECAPGTLTAPVIESLLRCGVNRVSLGVQSFVDSEAAAVGRLHRHTTVCDDIVRLRTAGISNINIDLIAGLPHQSAESWQRSLSEAILAGAPHVSTYMLEVDEESRLGRELMAGGTRYHAHFVPDEDLTADFYLSACQVLALHGIAQYEISNFALEGFQSRHNLKYWTRQPYLGFGVDAHSMLRVNHNRGENESVRFSTSDSLDYYLRGYPLQQTAVTCRDAIEESFFLGLRLNRGVNLQALSAEFGADMVEGYGEVIEEAISQGLLSRSGDTVCLSSRGRLLSNELFQRFLQHIEAA
jgi:oxygen-independent coproporphyrinogen III oxidase